MGGGNEAPVGYVDEPDESLMEQRKKLKPAAAADEPKTRKEVEEAGNLCPPIPRTRATGKSVMKPP